MSPITPSPGTCSALRTAQLEQFHPAMGRPMSAGEGFFTGFLNNANICVMNHFYEQARLAGINIRLEEFCELTLFSEFLADHVQPDGTGNVQCMLLWNEWVRTFRRHTHQFPKLLLEKECRSVMMEKFGIGIIENGFRGTVYYGIRFVP